MDYSQTIDDVFETLEDYNSIKLIVVDADMKDNKKLSTIAKEPF